MADVSYESCPTLEDRMLRDHPVYPALPTADLDRLRRFYEDVLGFTVRHENARTIYYGSGGGTLFALARSAGRPSGSHTQMAFLVSDVDAEVEGLRAEGVVFETYETPPTVDGIADMDVGRAAWFKDPDGNLVGMIQLNDPF
jgi:catechol 2,3-dioxygenase-like lactoylglutathione lyase family enzyme